MTFENEDITFSYDAYAISTAAAEILKTKAAFLNANPSLIVLIEGHCDERGTVEYNLALGDRRAKAARDYLCALGIAPERIRTSAMVRSARLILGRRRRLGPKTGGVTSSSRMSKDGYFETSNHCSVEQYGEMYKDIIDWRV